MTAPAWRSDEPTRTRLFALAVLALLVVGIVTLGIVAMITAADPVTRPSVTVDRQLDELERRQRDDRYLLCQIADATSVDGNPAPCLGVEQP
ncbi:MAG TPA: hypothetical protein VF640_00765 [Acidimicrobiales bacterium]|jgi:hypothetical protein